MMEDDMMAKEGVDLLIEEEVMVVEGVQLLLKHSKDWRNSGVNVILGKKDKEKET
jgi:hypothetical protein